MRGYENVRYPLRSIILVLDLEYPVVSRQQRDDYGGYGQLLCDRPSLPVVDTIHPNKVAHYGEFLTVYQTQCFVGHQSV